MQILIQHKSRFSTQAGKIRYVIKLPKSCW